MKEPNMTGEEIVISGISGLFPNTDNTRDLIRNLYNKVDMVAESTDTSVKHAELPKHFGGIHGLEKFDAQFFRVTPVQADSFDPVGRKILEQAYSAIFDAGINPETLKGSTLGVFIGSSTSDTATLNLYEYLKQDGYVITGCSKTMLANRISYWIDGKGPSFGLDHACASSIACLELAFQRMKAGECDSAIVGGCNHSIHPTLTINMKRAGLLCLDGKTKCFDKNGDGFVRSDAINMFFLQKSRDAKRIYAEVYNVNEKYITNPDALFLPSRSPDDVAELMENLYSEIDVSPEEIEYIEANATGLVEADANEVEAIAKVFAKNKPIKVGSVKSNMGHTQAVSGACSLTKLCLSYQTGEIPANLHYKEPLKQITKEGRVQVVTENTKFGRGFTALNNFSINGANYHVLLKGHYKPKELKNYKTSLPRLILASGRNDSSVYKIFDLLENNPIDVEELALLNNIFKYNTPGHTGRGYTILAPKDNEQLNNCLGKGFEYYSGTTRPVWFLYSGMGSQWPGMGTALMRVPIFAAAIQRCNNVLHPKGLDVYKIITENDGTMFDNILHSFVGITAVQIGLTDILKAVGLKPNNIIGHSAGEIACAYADECLSAEECILLSYYRGLVSLKTMLIKGKMAAIGLGHRAVRDLCPPEIDIACKNSATSTTISGPADVVEKFVADLQSQSIFAKVVASSNIAYHSRYIADAGPKLKAELEKVLRSPKARSQKWLSTCFLPDQWNDVISKTASPEYFTYNLLNTVHFEEAASMIPADAIVIEVAPHGLMQAIVKRSHSSCLNVALTKRGSEDNVVVLLNALGTLYQAGVSLNADVLYPPIEFPVSTETPVISHFVGWDHSENWCTSNFDLIKRTKIFAREFNISIHDEEYNFLKHYERNGINIFPQSTILIKVWETAAMYKETTCEQTPITFTNVNFHSLVRIIPEEVLRLRVHVQPGSNLFEVTHDDKLITSGAIEFEIEDNYNYQAIPFDASSISSNISTTDIYKLLHMRGYGCEGKFQCIQSANIERDLALLKWENDWNFFLDGLFQLNALSSDFDGVSVIKLINKLSINPIEHTKLEKIEDNQSLYCAQIFRDLDICKCGGFVLKSIILKNEPVLENTVDILQTHTRPGHDLASNIEVVTVAENVSTFDNVKLVDNGNKFVWTEIPAKEDAIQVAFAGISLNKHSSNKVNKFGTDFSGTTSRGEKVMGIVPDNNITSLLEPHYEFLWPVPQFWTMEEAATVPLPYIQAYYCISFRKSLNRGDTVLISNGDSGFGQALISICLSYDCTIFTTVKNIQKKKLLLRIFPKLKENQIGHSNKDSFLHMVRSATNGNGCDFVINDSKTSLREAAMGCVGQNSTLLNICEVGMKMNETFGMACLTYDRNYMAVCFSNIFLEENHGERKILQSLLAEGIAMGVVRPLTRVVYSPTNISRALQLLSKDDHFDRILINIQNKNASKSSCDILPRLQLNPKNIYMVVCDGSELGVDLAGHLIRRGARRLLLQLEPHMMDGYFHVKYALWKKNNVGIQLHVEDLNKKSHVESFIKVGTKLGSVGGIFICQNEVKDPDNNYEKSFASIVASLDSASRNISNLCYFAVIALTERRLTNNAEFSNIENWCFERNKLGLPALALRHAMNGKNISRSSLSRLFNALDSSLKKNLISVLSADQLEEPETSNPVSTGFGAFFRQVDIDEYTANEPMICMKTQLNNENESELYIDPDEDHLMVVPGFDGLYQNMTAVSERLKILAVTLQLEPDFDKSIDQIASRLVELVKTRFHLKSKFYLFGYSFGVNVALKTASLLEKEGRSGIVFCLDSSPDALRTQLDAFLGDLTDAQLQNSLIQHIFNLLTGKTSLELTKTLEAIENWSEKVELFVRIVKQSVSYTHEFLRSYMNVSYRRLVLAKEYQPDFKLNSDVVLIKGAPHPRCIQSEDYGLSKFTTKPVKVFNIRADHVSAPQDGRVSAIVNKILDHKYLEVFKKKNLCQYYIEATA